MTHITKLLLLLRFVSPFTVPKSSTLLLHRQSSSSLREARGNNSAEQLLAQAKAIRDSIPSSTDTIGTANDVMVNVQNEFALPPSNSDDSSGCCCSTNDYKLTVDIGREPGTWMDPRWGASGRRIEFTLDVSFPIITSSSSENYGSSSSGGNREEEVVVASASRDIATSLLKCVTSQSNSVSRVYEMTYAPYARLKRGFDKMEILDGGYCIETTSSNRASSSSTLRFFISVAGTEDDNNGSSS